MPKAKTKAANASIYALVGSDEAEVKRAAAELATKLTRLEAGDFGQEVIDGAVDNAEQAAARIRSTIEALQTLPFLGGAKLVWLKNANFLGDNVIGRAASVQATLDELAEVIGGDLGADVTFLLSATAVDKRRSFYKSLAKRAELQVFARLASSRTGWEEEATEIVRGRAKGHKLQFDDDALDLFVLLTGGDTRQIENELDKIDTYCGTGFQPAKSKAVDKTPGHTPKTATPGVTVDLVRKLVPLSRAGIIFEL